MMERVDQDRTKAEGNTSNREHHNASTQSRGWKNDPMNVLCTGLKRKSARTSYDTGREKHMGVYSYKLDVAAPPRTLPSSLFESNNWRLLLSRIGIELPLCVI